MSGPLDRRASDLNTADLTAIVLMFISLGIALVAADRVDPVLMWIAAAVSLPAGVLKVRSSRAKSRRWHQPVSGGEPRDRRVACALESSGDAAK